MNIPAAYHWFAKLKQLQFIPWSIDATIETNPNTFIDNRFQMECPGREVLTFAARQDQDTFAGFEVVNGEITEKVLVFHPSFQTNTKDWNIVENEYSDFFDFMQRRALPDMKDWIPDDDVADYLQ
ncbi:hypothetical protein [Flavobacterium sp.]|uniref:hypothetical protein n=1 Tax=Flavobacterium sp. TaxID=239 RepID=UPI0039E635BC